MIDGINALIGSAVRTRREEAGLSQGDLAIALGLTRPSVSNIESGRQPISIEKLYVAADTLGVNVNDLLPDSFNRGRRNGRQSIEAERLMDTLTSMHR